MGGNFFQYRHAVCGNGEPYAHRVFCPPKESVCYKTKEDKQAAEKGIFFHTDAKNETSGSLTCKNYIKCEVEGLVFKGGGGHNRLKGRLFHWKRQSAYGGLADCRKTPGRCRRGRSPSDTFLEF